MKENNYWLVNIFAKYLKDIWAAIFIQMSSFMKAFFSRQQIIELNVFNPCLKN